MNVNLRGSLIKRVRRIALFLSTNKNNAINL